MAKEPETVDNGAVTGSSTGDAALQKKSDIVAVQNAQVVDVNADAPRVEPSVSTDADGKPIVGMDTTAVKSPTPDVVLPAELGGPEIEPQRHSLADQHFGGENEEITRNPPVRGGVIQPTADGSQPDWTPSGAGIGQDPLIKQYTDQGDHGQSGHGTNTFNNQEGKTVPGATTSYDKATAKSTNRDDGATKVTVDKDSKKS